MKQGLLAFQYEQEKSSTGMTALSGLMTYLELMQAAGLRSSVERHVRLRERGQGWTDSQMIISLMLLNLAGGESVSDLDLLEKDEGLCKMLGEFETCGMRRRERRALEKRWRVERRRRVPSESAVFRYLERFHDVDEESKREAHRAFIAAPNKRLRVWGRSTPTWWASCRAVRLTPRPLWTWMPHWWRRASRRRSTATRSRGRTSR